MASEDRPEPKGREPLSPAKRKRLQQCFEHASKQMAQENHDYATELLTQCVLGDPGNQIYAQSFLGNLQKKYNNNKKGSKLALFRGTGVRGGLKKATYQKDWEGVIRHGLDLLKLNPWDVGALSAMATAIEATGSGLEESELVYLKSAADVNPKDPDINRQCALALARRGQFDQAIFCWHRVEQAKPGDEEAARAIADLAVEKTIAKGGYEEAAASRQSGGTRPPTHTPTHTPTQDELSPEEQLQQQIAKDPQTLANYYELAQLHFNNERYKEAEEVLTKAFEVSGGDPDVRERWEDAQLRHLAHRVILADKQAKATGSQEAVQEFKRLRKELRLKELEVCKYRCERYPNNLGFKYDLGVRYQRVGDYNEAIKHFQLARNDPRRKGACLLALAQCFQQIKQPRLAMSHYSSAIDEIPDRDLENKKLALYQAGKLALVLHDVKTAGTYLRSLAALDFAYKDVSSLLDKIDELGDDGVLES